MSARFEKIRAPFSAPYAELPLFLSENKNNACRSKVVNRQPKFG
jgi:hypothetical protein